MAGDMNGRSLAESLGGIRYGLAYNDGRLVTNPKDWGKLDARDIVVQSPEELRKSGIGMCHDVTQALHRELEKRGILHRAVMLQCDHSPDLPTHSFILSHEDGRTNILDPLSYDEKGVYGLKSDYAAIRRRLKDWRMEGDKGKIRNYDIPEEDWEKKGLLDFLGYKQASDDTLDEAVRRIKSHIVVNKGLDPDDVAQRILQLHMGRIFQHIFMVKAFARMIAAKHRNASWVPKMEANVLQHDKHKWNDVEFMGDYAPYIVEEYVGSKWFHTNEGYEKVHERIGEKHRMLSDHHVDHWCPFRKYSERNGEPLVPLLMPDYALAEMCADWMAVSMEKGGTATEWFRRNQGKKWRFTKDQAKFIESILKDEPEFRRRFKSA